jgi:hypothetical protein
VIELPDSPAPNGVNITPIDFGFLQRPGSGAASLRINRPGNRYRVELMFPPMTPDVARKFTARAQRAVSDGLRAEVPLLDLKQGSPGASLVDGAVAAMVTSLPVKGLTPYYAVKEGYWLHVEDGDGVRYLHTVTAAAVAEGSGDLAISIWPPIRAPLADGDTIELGKPTVEGVLIENPGWSLSVDRLVRFGGSIVIEEAA